MKTISYAEILSLWKKGLGNGAIRRLDALKKGLFSAALCYCQMKGQILNTRLITALEGIADIILNTAGRRILKKGIERVAQLGMNEKMLKCFPILATWLKDSLYILWLGTESLIKRSWIFFGARQ